MSPKGEFDRPPQRILSLVPIPRLHILHDNMQIILLASIFIKKE